MKVYLVVEYRPQSDYKDVDGISALSSTTILGAYGDKAKAEAYVENARELDRRIVAEYGCDPSAFEVRCMKVL